jgi:hypothetical protein
MNLLSPGAIKAIKCGEKPIFNVQILQCKGVVAPNTTGSPARYKLLVTDGVEHMAAICATQLNDQIANGIFKAFSVVKISNFSLNDIQGQKYVIHRKCILYFVAFIVLKISNLIIFILFCHFRVMIVVGMELVADMLAQIPQYIIELDGYKTSGATSVSLPAPPSSVSYGSTPPVANPYQQQPNPYQQQQQQQQQQQHGDQGSGANPYGAPARVANPYDRGAVVGARSGGYDAYGSGNNKPTMRVDSGMQESIVPINAINPYSSR